MKFYLLLVYVTVALVAFYYLTVFLHIFFGIFGEKVEENRVFIPFYGWIKGIKHSKQKEGEVEASMSAISEQKQKTKKNTKTVKKKKTETLDDKNDNE